MLNSFTSLFIIRILKLDYAARIRRELLYVKQQSFKKNFRAPPYLRDFGFHYGCCEPRRDDGCVFLAAEFINLYYHPRLRECLMSVERNIPTVPSSV